MKLKLLPIVLLMLSVQILIAEGTREVAPNASITVEGNSTTDLAALLINDDRFNSFASYTNPDPNGRLYIHIQDPEKECIYLGFSFAHPNWNSPFPPAYDYEYRIKDPNGNVVFGPVFVDGMNANIENWSEAVTGPAQLTSSGGYNAMEVTSAQLTSQGWNGKGDYYVEFRSSSTPDDFLIDFWDITVVDCSVSSPIVKPGRIWSFNWAFFAVNDFGFPNRPFNGAFYVCAPDPDNPDAAFITKIDFLDSGFRPAAFNVAFNSFGVENTGNITEDRKSAELINLTQAEYAIFLNDPVDICKTAEVGQIDLLGVSRCPGEEFCIKFVASKEGQVDLLLDFDGPDQIYTPGTADIMLTRNISSAEVGTGSCIEWDGKDGLGNVIPESADSQIPVVLSFAQGVYHFPVYDAEYMIQGFNIQAVRPSSDQPLLYYDDSNISVLSGSGEPQTQLLGCTLPCHRWTNFTDNDTPGFGNVNTINSWWFSQLIVKEQVFFFPATLECAINGPSVICEGSSAMLSYSDVISPVGANGPEVISQSWSGPDIVGPSIDETITIESGGTYFLDLLWKNSAGDTCFSSCAYTLESLPVSSETIDTLIVSGEMIELNGQTYAEGGIYTQQLIAANGCDSILTIIVNVIQTIAYYNLDACRSYTDDGSAEDYSEFIGIVPEPISCAQIQPDTLFRENPMINKHSCTPGVFDSPAMCVSTVDGCDFDPGNEKAVVFEILVEPSTDTAVVLTGFSFYEKAPDMYDWIDGNSGPNNFPTLYGVRVLKDDIQIFEQKDIPTSNEWTKEIFDFKDLQEFSIDQPTTFRFELLGYCLIGNNTPIAAWDLDEISIQASCASPSLMLREVSGTVRALQEIEMHNIQVQLSNDQHFETIIDDISSMDGSFAFQNITSGGPYYVRPLKTDNCLQGVSTLDLIRIQRHLLNIEPFDKPYQYIAADANKSETISAIDLVELKKLILGIYEALPDNQSWRFTHSELPSNPYTVFQLDEVFKIDDLNKNIDHINFLGIKIGNVDGEPSDHNGFNINYREKEIFELHFENRFVMEGETFLLDVFAQKEVILNGMQVALSLKGIDILDVISGGLDIEESYHHNPAKELLKLSWHQAPPLDIDGGATFFTIMMQAKKDGHISDIISIAENGIQSQVYIDKELKTLPVTLNAMGEGHEENRAQNFEVIPNPVSDHGSILVDLAHADIAKVRFYNPGGKVVYERIFQLDQGKSRINFTKNDFNIDAGIVFVQIETEQNVIVKRIILQ